MTDIENGGGEAGDEGAGVDCFECFGHGCRGEMWGGGGGEKKNEGWEMGDGDWGVLYLD